MKNFVSLFFALFFLTSLAAAQRRSTVKKDSLVIGCMLKQAVYDKPDKNLNAMGEPELKLVLHSDVDTIVTAPWDLQVSTVKRLEYGTFELVASHQDYWFWFSGLDKAYIVRNQKLKQGQPIGQLQTGARLELMVYDFETPVDPAIYVRCP